MKWIVAATVAGTALLAGCGNNGSPKTASDGAAIYAANCARCHGPTGEGATGPALGRAKLLHDFPKAKDEEIFVGHGVAGTMPGWKGVLSDDQIAAVVAYTRSLP